MAPSGWGGPRDAARFHSEVLGWIRSRRNRRPHPPSGRRSRPRRKDWSIAAWRMGRTACGRSSVTPPSRGGGMTMAATKSRIPLRTACAAWSAVRKSSSRRNGKIEPAESLMSLTALPPKAPVQKAMPGSTLVDPRPQRRTAPQNAWRMPSRGSRPRTHTCALKRKRRFPACHQSAPRASSPSSGSADGRRRRDPRRTEPSGCVTRQAVGRSLLSLWEIAGPPAELRLGMGEGRTGPYLPCSQRLSMSRMPVCCQKGKPERLP